MTKRKRHGSRRGGGGAREEHDGSRMRGFLPEASRKRGIKLAKKRDSFSRKEGHVTGSVLYTSNS